MNRMESVGEALMCVGVQSIGPIVFGNPAVTGNPVFTLTWFYSSQGNLIRSGLMKPFKTFEMAQLREGCEFPAWSAISLWNIPSEPYKVSGEGGVSDDLEAVPENCITAAKLVSAGRNGWSVISLLKHEIWSWKMCCLLKAFQQGFICHLNTYLVVNQNLSYALHAC